MGACEIGGVIPGFVDATGAGCLMSTGAIVPANQETILLHKAGSIEFNVILQGTITHNT